MTKAQKQIAVIGGGPAGLMAAERLARHYGALAQVTVYERMATPARKFLMAGRGGLNITHSEAGDLFLSRYGAARDWLAPMVAAFTPDDLRNWCAGLGQETFVGSSGRVFPRAMKASPLLRAWRYRLDELNVMVRLHHEWRGFSPAGHLRVHDLKHGRDLEVAADAVLLALGGGSWPRLGSDGAWCDVLAGRGIEVVALRAANAGFAVPWSPYLRDRFAGQPLKPVALTHQGQRVQGEAMITQAGIEGGAVYALSAGLRDTLARTGTAVLLADLRPNMTVQDLTQRLSAARQGMSLANFLRRAANLSPLAVALLHETAEEPHGVQGMDAAALAARIKAVPLRVTGMMPLERAISSAGGVSRASLDDALMLAALPGVFVAGEMIDWEAPTGGYLLQASFATGVAAAEGIIRYLEKQ